MSRKYPMENREDRFKDDPVPWPYLTARVAAKVLGVDPVFLDGLANNPIRACKRPGKTGTPITLFCRDDIEALAGKMGR